MNRLIALLLSAGLVLPILVTHAQSTGKTFPTITTKNLNEKTATFPANLPGQRTLVLIAFYRKQQADLDVWIEKLGLTKPKAPEWIEMPVVQNYGILWRAFVGNGMRSGIKTTEARARVYTVYGNQDNFRGTLDLPTADQVYVLVVSRDGTIIARADGAYSPENASHLRKALAATRIRKSR